MKAKRRMVPDRLRSFAARLRDAVRRLPGRSGGLLLGLSVIPALCWVLVMASCSLFNGRSAVDDRKVRGSEPDIRVRIKKTAEIAELSVAGGSSLVVRPIGIGRPEVLSGPLIVKSGSGGLNIASPGSVGRDFGAGIDVEVLASGAGESEGTLPLKVDGVTYSALIRLRARSDDASDRFDVIATVKIEEYLPGVVVKEMYPNWPKEAFKVQAVCSRSYALHERERARASGKPFDVESSTLDQVYGGVTTNAAAREAVAETRGVVLSYAGTTLRAYYSSTCGGRAASAADIFPTSAGYEFNLAGPLQAKERETYCEKSPWYRWDVVRSTDELGQRLRAWGRYAGKGIKNSAGIARIEAVTMNVADRPARYLITDSKGTNFYLNAEEFRVASNYSVEGQPGVSKDTRMNSGDALVEVVGPQVRVRGRGFGHGVGMCQWCVRGMAERGKDWKAILADFYPGARLQTGY